MNMHSLLSENPEVREHTELSRKERHRLLHKADILRAAERVFAQKGFHQATIQDIARQAQYATGTVYLYFEDKDELYFSIIEEKIRSLLLILKGKTALAKGAEERLEVYICESLRFFDRNRDFFRIFIQEDSRWSIKSRMAGSPVSRQRKELLAGLIREAQSEGLIRKDLEIPRVSAILESTAATFVFDWWEGKGTPERDFPATTRTIMDLCLHGVGKR